MQGVGTFLLLAAFRRGRQPAITGATTDSPPPGTSRWRLRFHLSDVLLANAVLAAFLAEVTYAATQPETYQWPIVSVAGLAAALLSGAAVWLAWGKSRLWIRTFAFAFAVLPTFVVAWRWADLSDFFWTAAGVWTAR